MIYFKIGRSPATGVSVRFPFGKVASRSGRSICSVALWTSPTSVIRSISTIPARIFIHFIENFTAAVGVSTGVWSPVVSVANLLDVLNNGSLSLLPFRPEHFRPDVHAATYKCQAASGAGKIISTPVHVRAGTLTLST
jgi:hypothetical protein